MLYSASPTPQSSMMSWEDRVLGSPTLAFLCDLGQEPLLGVSVSSLVNGDVWGSN